MCPAIPAQDQMPLYIHELSVIFSAMKNVTITLDEKTAAWARKQAAERDISLSRFVGEVLQQNMRQAREYERAMHRFLEAEPVELKGASEPYPRREELYDRGRLR